MNDTFPTLRRRWFRFGLRTMFVVLTGFSVWFGYKASWVNQRRSYIAEQRTWMRRVGLDVNPYTMANNQVRGPGMTWLIGESGIAKMFVAYQTGNEGSEVQKAKRLFPEAAIVATLEIPVKSSNVVGEPASEYRP